MTSSTEDWQASKQANYDSEMIARCAALLSEVIANPTYRQLILSDPRDLHRELFGDFAPEAHGEYAGTYRGTPGTTLAGRKCGAPSELAAGTSFEFFPPSMVPEAVERLLKNIGAALKMDHPDDYTKLLALTHTFCWFGRIHPFLDGNGHIQRAIFAAMASEFGFMLSQRFAIHPRPYDRLLALGLELFTRAPEGRSEEALLLVAEYLAFFLSGSFDAPRRNVPYGALYGS